MHRAIGAVVDVDPIKFAIKSQRVMLHFALVFFYLVGVDAIFQAGNFHLGHIADVEVSVEGLAYDKRVVGIIGGGQVHAQAFAYGNGHF